MIDRNKTKFKEVTQLKRIIKYLNQTELNRFKISFGNKISVDLFDVDLELFKKILVENTSHILPNTLRITVGKNDENKRLLEEIHGFFDESGRTNILLNTTYDI